MMTDIELFEAIVTTPGVVGLDFETTIERAFARTICTIQVAHEDEREVVLHLWSRPDLIPRVVAALNKAKCEFAAHFAVFEAECLWKLGIRPKNLKCTYVASRVLHGAMTGDSEEEEEYGGWSLADLVLGRFGVVLSKKLQKQDWTQPLTPEGIEYCLEDSRWARDLWISLWDEFDRDPESRAGFDVVNDAVPTFARCNLHHGMEFDHAAHGVLCKKLDENLRMHIFAMDIWSGEAVRNHASGKQVSEWICQYPLLDEVRTPRSTCDIFLQVTDGTNWGLTATGQLRLDKNTMTRVLEDVEIVNPTVGGYLRSRMQYQKDKKILDAFGPKLATLVDIDRCIRGSLIPHGAKTSRASCRDPNLQQMPKDDEFRACFRARKGRKMVICDYGQIELRVGCIIADDKRMQSFFAQGLDIHAATAVAVYGLGQYDPENPIHRKLRGKAKAPNFAALYGAMVSTIALHTGLPMWEAAELLNKWLETYPGIARFREEMPVIGRQQGYVQLVSGQKIKVLEDTRPAQMINAPVQGGAATVMYRAAALVDWALEAAGLDAVLSIVVHDELIIDASEEDAVAAAEIVQREMVRALLEYFPIAKELGVDNVADASVCDHWGEKDLSATKLANYIERMAA